MTGLLSFSLVRESSLFLFLGGGLGFSLVIVEFSFSSIKGFPVKGLPVLSTEFEESVESSVGSGLASGPKTCKKSWRLPNLPLVIT